MKKSQPSLIYGFLVVISIIFGPICFLVRGSSTSPLEKFMYAISFFPLGLLAIQVRYLEGKRDLMKMPDSGDRENEIQAWTQQHMRLIAFGVAGALLAAMLFAWIIFVRMPART